MKSTLLALALPLALFACAGAGPAVTPGQPAYGVPAAATAQPASATPPQFDRQGNPNYDSSGNYIGPHGVGQMVGPDDNPDRNPQLSSTMPSAADFPAGSCTTTPMGTQCRSSTTTTSSSSASCVTIGGTTRCDQSSDDN